MRGTVFDIKEFTVHDGPGSRITVFLKGCPLRCRWCHNPEGLSAAPQLMVQKNGCTGCGACFAPCEHPACQPFGRCLHACPNGLLKCSGQEWESADLAAHLQKHQSFFAMTGGGITLSGGEPLMQADFVCDLVDRLEGIHTALQTSGYADPAVYRRVVDRFDYILQDIKLVDSALHRRYTGVDNALILQNIAYLKASKKQFVFRMPMIPGITDTPENIAAAKELAGGYPLEFLDYNPLAGAKYEMLGMTYPLTELDKK